MLVYKLIPTEDYNALMIDGILMHRIKGTTPKKDAELKVKILGIKGGKVLDICTGLGYTAIEAAKFADEVITIENDENVIEMQKINEFSKELFENKKIKQIIGDAVEIIKNFENEIFDYIIHDPPRFSRAGKLYSKEFYKELYRVLKYNGKIFHYVGEPGKRYRKKDIMKGVANRMRDVGFKVEIVNELEGIIGYKK